MRRKIEDVNLIFFWEINDSTTTSECGVDFTKCSSLLNHFSKLFLRFI